MTSTYRHHITKNIISILLSNGERDMGLFGYLNVTTIIEPFQRVRLGIRNSRHTRLLNEECRGHIGVTSSINNQVANLILDDMSKRSFPSLPCHQESLRYVIHSLKQVV